MELARCLAHEDGGIAAVPVPVEHVAPAAGCRCRIYGWYQPHDLRMLYAPVFGVIAASGLSCEAPTDSEPNKPRSSR